MMHAMTSPYFVINGNVIEESVKVKYLGHIICNDDDMMRQRRQLYVQGNVISRRFHMCSVEVKNMLFSYFLYTHVYMPVMVEVHCIELAQVEGGIQQCL